PAEERFQPARHRATGPMSAMRPRTGADRAEEGNAATRNVPAVGVGHKTGSTKRALRNIRPDPERDATEPAEAFARPAVYGAGKDRARSAAQCPVPPRLRRPPTTRATTLSAGLISGRSPGLCWSLQLRPLRLRRQPGWYVGSRPIPRAAVSRMLRLHC